MNHQTEALSDFERQVYEWQMWIDGFGEAGQVRLKAASVLISRYGGLGGAVAPTFQRWVKPYRGQQVPKGRPTLTSALSRPFGTDDS